MEVRSAGRSGEGRELLYATVGQGPDVFWLQARIHGNELHSTEAVLQVSKYLAASGDPVATRIRQQLTVIVIPMYNPDGAEANIRQSTTPLQIDLNRDWELFRQPESRAWYALWEQTHPGSPWTCTTWARARSWRGPTSSTPSRSVPARSTQAG